MTENKDLSGRIQEAVSRIRDLRQEKGDLVAQVSKLEHRIKAIGERLDMALQEREEVRKQTEELLDELDNLKET